MLFYLQDSGSVYWQLGVTTDGREQNTVVGAQLIVALVEQDASGIYWQLGITTDGRLTATVVGATTTTSIVLADSSSQLWTLGVSGAGRTLFSPVSFEPAEDGYIPPLSGGFDSLVTVW
jgi:hypothetical protein